MVESDRPNMTIWRMCIAYWITKATNINSRNTYCFSTTTSGTRTRIHVKFLSTFPVLPQYAFSLILSGVTQSLTVLHS